MATTRAMETERDRLPPPARDHPSVYDPTPYLNGPRNEYLTVCVPEVNPRILSRAVDRAMMRSDPCLRHCNPPLLALQEAAPNIYAPHVESAKAAEVFGRRLLPNLRHDLDHDDTEELRRAITAISDILHDPKTASQAVRVSLVGKLVEIMNHGDPTIRERSCAVVETLATHTIGRDAVLEEPKGLAAILEKLLDPVPAVRFRAVLALRTLARFRLGSYDMNEGELSPYLVQVMRVETNAQIVGVLTTTLRQLLELTPTKEICISDGAFEPLSEIIKSSCAEAIGGACESISRLATCTMGKTVADERETLAMPEIPELLRSKNSFVSSRAAMMVMNLTHTKKGKIMAYEFNLLKPLVELARHRTNRRAQMCAMQALTNVAEYKPCRTFLEGYDEQLARIEVTDDAVDEVRKRLLGVVRWRP